MTELLKDLKSPLNRRSFVKKGLMAAGAATMGTGLLSSTGFTESAHQQSRSLSRNGSLSAGDAALLRFVAAAETLEADFWIQYNELGGVQDSEVPGGSGSPAYTQKFVDLDDDFPQYIHDNTDDTQLF